MTRRLPVVSPAPESEHISTPPHQRQQARHDDLTVNRRQALAAITGIPAAIMLDRAERAWRQVMPARAAGIPFEPRFFHAHEWRTVRLLADHVIPRDARSGSATDAGVPEFMDFMMLDQPALQTPIRGGLRWLDAHCLDRFGTAFADCRPAEQTAVLDDIAWPARARSDMGPGARFFTEFRDLTASGFWTSPMGIADLQYMGNTVVHEWDGCPSAALAKLGVSYGA